MVIELHGSLTDFSRKLKTYDDLEKKFHTNRMTIFYAIKNYKARNGYVDLRKKNGAHVKFKVA
jgi:cell division septal protein FtsQ